jgi:four helix bundle protein
MEDFRKLEVYQLAREYSKAVFMATRKFPAYLKPKLAAQLDDAAESIGSNIAEGCGKKNWKHSNVEFVRYLHHAFSSASEAQHRVCGAYDKELISEDVYTDLENRVQTLKAKLTRFMQYLERNDRGRID